MNTLKQEYVGKWYYYYVCGCKVIIKITGTEEAGANYDDDSYTGTETILMDNGISISRKWACYYKAFESNIKNKKYKDFHF